MSSQPRPSTSHVTKASPKAKPLSRILFSSPSRRAASRRAEDKIQGYFTAEEEFHTKTAIEDANAFEESAMFTGMRSMSLTPGAKGRVVGGDEMGETVESLALPDDSVNDMVQDLQNDGDAGGKVVDQGNYRRPTVRDAGENGEEDEVDEEVDISEYIYTNGIILHVSQIEDYVLTMD